MESICHPVHLSSTATHAVLYSYMVNGELDFTFAVLVIFSGMYSA